MLIKAVQDGNDEVRSGIAHGLYRVSFLSPSTLAFRVRRDEGDFNAAKSVHDLEALGQTEKEFMERMRRRLSIKKIGVWLDEHGGREKILIPEELITGEEAYIRFVYALLYGDSRSNFSYTIEEKDETASGSVKAADYVVPDIRFRRSQKI
jgi:hypothetical protein